MGATRKQITLTSERIEELQSCRDVLARQGYTGLELTDQRVISAAMQTLTGYVNSGGKLNFVWDDKRTSED